MYTGFFIIEAATYGLILEQKVFDNFAYNVVFHFWLSIQV